VGADLGVGAHWRRDDGSLLKIGDGRTPLPGAIEPGGELTLPLEIRPPNAPGTRTLEVDLVQERVAWFRERGSVPARLPVEIAGAGGAAEDGAAQAGFEPWIEMHCIARDEVTAFVESCGGRVAHVLPDQSAGDAFESYLYVVERVGAAAARPALGRLRAALAQVPDREDLLPPIDSFRSGARRRLELWTKRRLARATRWFTKSQVAHDRAVARALAEVEAALLVQEAEIRSLRAELERRRQARPRDG
jgi:hypothetical protein